MDRVSLIYKVLSEDATPEEKADLERWMLESEDNRQEFEDIRLLWENSPSQDEDYPADDNSFEMLRRRINRLVRRRRRIRVFFSSLLLALTAVSILLLLRATWFATPEQLQFDEMKMSEVIKVLEGRYGIEIPVRNPAILRCRYTAVLLEVEDEEPVLRSIEHSLNVKFIDLGNGRYELVGTNCPAGDPGRQFRE